MLVRGHVRVLSPRLPPAFLAPADMHSEQTDFRLRRCLHIRHRYVLAALFCLQHGTGQDPRSTRPAYRDRLRQAESFAAVLLLVPKLCRWGAWLTGLMLVALMICIAYYSAILRGRFLS
jgi:hypothetical protein